jgi:plastocyanin
MKLAAPRRRSQGRIAIHVVSLQPTPPRLEDDVNLKTAAQGPPPLRRRTWLVLPAAVAALIVLAGCGSSSKTTSSSSSAAESTPTTSSAATSTPASTAPTAGAGETLKLAANPEGQLAFEPKSLTAKSGKVTIDFTNSSPVGHNVSVETSSGQTVGSTPTFQGGSKTLSLNLKAGSYKFFCSVPGHRQAGMEGTLTVQ